MTADEFMRKVRRSGRKARKFVRYDARRGAGSHGRRFYGDQFTTVIDPRHELGPGLLRKMCRDLGIDPTDI